MGGHIVVRTGSLLLAFIIAGAVLARRRRQPRRAPDRLPGLRIFLALVLDAIAIAGQVLVGRMLGARDAAGALAAARPMLGWSLVGGCALGLGLLATRNLLPNAFSSDAAVLDRAHELWPLFALMLPAGALTLRWIGILLGAGDTRFLAYAMAFSALAVFVPITLLSLHFHWGVVGVWWGLNALMSPAW